MSYYKFLKETPYLAVKNSYVYFLLLNHYFKEYLNVKISLLKTAIHINTKKKKTITIFKTPMAHKKFSKEQLFLRYTYIIYSIKQVNFFKLVTIKILFQLLSNVTMSFSKINNNLLLLKVVTIKYRFTYKLKF